MLTKFHSQSSIKKKFTVITIWLIALGMIVSLVQFILHASLNLFELIPLIALGIFMILGILLRCKIARWFTLLLIYSVAFTPLVAYFMIAEVPTISHLIVYSSLLVVSIYVFSNNKAMDLFYIESNPSEHLPLILLALTINALYIYLVRVV